MSSWSEYKCGALTREEYEFECRQEARMDEYDAYEYEEEDE